MDYSKYSRIAKDKISKYGSSCKLKRIGTEYVYNPKTDNYEGAEIEIKGMGLLSNFDNSQINGTSILAGDVKLMCVFEQEPLLTDKLIFGSTEYTIVNISAINPDGNCVIYYDIQAR